MITEPSTCLCCQHPWDRVVGDPFLTCPACRRPDDRRHKTPRIKTEGRRGSTDNDPWYDNSRRSLEDRDS